MKYLVSIFNGLIVGILAAICILYVFQVKTPYPIWILKSFEKGWVLFILFLLGVVFLGFNKEAGVLLIIISVALFIDKFLFARNIEQKPQIISVKSAPISNKIYVEDSKKVEDHGITLLPLSNTPPGSISEEGSKYLPLAEINANEKGLKDYKDKLLDKNKEFHDNLKPEFGSNYILTTDEYATISDR